MKELHELELPETLYYTKEHEWATVKDDIVLIGITDYAQDQLGDIVFVEMPEVGDTFSAGEEFGTLESVKAVSELYMPVTGEIAAVNEDLDDTPELLNQAPYANWIIKVKLENAEELEELLNRNSYLEMIEGK